MSKLDREEKEILKSFDKGLPKAARGKKKKMAAHIDAAAATFKKDSSINIRISSKD